MASRRGFLAAAAGMLASPCFGVDKRVSHAVGSNGSRVKLYSDADNYAALQALLDVAPEVRLPPGNWPISRTLVYKLNGQRIRSYGVDACTLRQYGAYTGPVLGIGAHPTWNPGGPNLTGCRLNGITLHQTVDASGASCMIIYEFCSDFEASNIRLKGSRYEGFISGSTSSFITLKHIEVLDCGNGGIAYPLSTAGINATSDHMLVEDFRCTGCGQGVEGGSQHVVYRRGTITDPGDGNPGIGINIGSTGQGIYDVVVEDCIISGYDSAIAVVNGIGRLCGVYIRRNKIYDEGDGDSPIEFAGGQMNNLVTGGDNPYEGPDLAGSEITDNEFFVSSPHDGVISYNTGPADGGNPNVYGREALTISRNTVRFVAGDTSLQTNPIFGFAGNITANCRLTDNIIHGLPAAPSRGDMQSYTNNANVAVPGFPTFRHGRNYAFAPSGERRAFVTNIEGA